VLGLVTEVVFVILLLQLWLLGFDRVRRTSNRVRVSVRIKGMGEVYWVVSNNSWACYYARSRYL